MGLYSKQGLYNSYKKNNKERESLDYYSTPTEEVENILNVLKINFNNEVILEPCVGGGHMAKGISNYINLNENSAKLIATDIKDRGWSDDAWLSQYGLDFLDDNYPFNSVDTVIMNPPYATLEPFLIRALEIAKKRLIVLCRTQALEGKSRYENIFINNPPTEIYQYVDRIQCYKNGIKSSNSSAQAYCWLIWDKEKAEKSISPPRLYWIRRK